MQWIYIVIFTMIFFIKDSLILLAPKNEQHSFYSTEVNGCINKMLQTDSKQATKCQKNKKGFNTAPKGSFRQGELGCPFAAQFGEASWLIAPSYLLLPGFLMHNPERLFPSKQLGRAQKRLFPGLHRTQGLTSIQVNKRKLLGAQPPPCTRPFDCPVPWLLSTAPDNAVVSTPAGTCSGTYLQDHLCHLELLLGHLVRAHGLVEEQAEHVVLLQGLLVILFVQVDHSVFSIVSGEVQSLLCLAAEKQVKTCQDPASRLHSGALGVQQRLGCPPPS